MRIPPPQRRIRSRASLEVSFVFTIAFLVSSGSLLIFRGPWSSTSDSNGTDAIRSSLESYGFIDELRKKRGASKTVPVEGQHELPSLEKGGATSRTTGVHANRLSPISRKIPSGTHVNEVKTTETASVPMEKIAVNRSNVTGTSVQNISSVQESTAMATMNGRLTESREKVAAADMEAGSNLASIPHGANPTLKSSVIKSVHENQSANMTSLALGEPHYFRDEVPLDLLIQRGNVLTSHTGCAIATWSYQGARHKYRPLNDCRQHAKSAQALRDHQVTADTASQVQANDTIYVPIVKLPHFVNTTLPNIMVDFVLISGQNSKPPDLIPRNVYNAILTHPRVIKWFLQNLSVYAMDAYHPKLRPFPYGVHPMQPPALLNEIKIARRKSNFIYVSRINKGTNIVVRRHIPNGEQVNATEYLKRMHQAEYVLSPEGDRPECHRTYEAIALGTAPITSLDPTLYRHLRGNVVFNETLWNVTKLNETLPRKPTVNQRLAFQEYWMEYVEREVGRPLRWWDPSRDIRCSLQEIVDVVKSLNSSDVESG